MTKDEAVKIAESVSMNFAHRSYEEDLLEFAAAIAAEEREACAKVCEELSGGDGCIDTNPNECAEAIRMRSNDGIQR